jgi:hypothetical protein
MKGHGSLRHAGKEHQGRNYHPAFGLRGARRRIFAASKWAIRHATLTFDDPTRNNRTVAVDVAVRRDKELRANAGSSTCRL